MAEWQLLIYGMTIFVLWKYFEHPFGTSVNIEKFSTKKCKGSSVKMYFFQWLECTKFMGIQNS
jgi:hypothetical protein